MKENGGPMYPVADISKTQCPGMSLRDWFAGMVAGHLVAHAYAWLGDYRCPEAVAKVAYEISDAMIAERNRESEGK